MVATSQPKNMLKSLNSKPGDLATKFISINGKHIMDRRSETYTQPLRDESVKSNVEQPSQHDDGNPLMPMRQVQFGTKRGDAMHEKPVNETQPPKDDGQRLTSDTWEDPNVCATKPTEATPSSPQKKSFLNVVTKETKNPTNLKVNFRSLVNSEQVENSDCVLPVEHVIAAQNKFANSLICFFVGKKVAFQLVQNYVSNTWSKFGFQKVMCDDDDVYYFKFTSMTGLEQVKVHKVPVVAYSKDGLSLIATQIGKPIMFDAFTNAMCAEPWGRLGFARALIEVTTEIELKHEVTMVVPVVDGEGHAMEKMEIKYDWKPLRQVGGKEDTITVKDKENDSDYESKVEEMVSEYDTTKGQALPHKTFLMFSMASWNIRGLNRIPKQSEVRQVMSENQLSVLSWSPMWISTRWSKDVVDVVVMAQTDQAVHAKVIHRADQKAICCTFIYAGNDPRERRLLWADLSLHKRVVRRLPWVLLGDFNVPLNMEDICTGFSSMNSAMCDFKDYVRSIEVMDIHNTGLHFTWNQKPRGRNGVLKKLDRIMGNLDFIDTYQGSFLEVLNTHWNISVAGHSMFQVVCTAIHDFFSNGKLLKEINHTFLALIPKVATPLKVNDYGPISCCNVIYKCISKILTNRIIEGIKEVVSKNYSAFVPGRQISDNILITQELMHNYHRNRGSPRCAFKVDIQKAYDTVDWRFLGFILKCFRFHSTMIKWIMACVTSASFSIYIKGLRQGDPLLPYLFTLVMEILTLILQRRVYDLFIFGHGDLESARVIMASLDEFKKVSGLIPSIPKSTTFFCNVLNHVKTAILNILPFAEGELPVNYLSVSLISYRLLNRDCKVLVEKSRNRIGDWKNKSLSFAGRLQLCKSVISSMQVYWVSVLVIPIGIVTDIQ
ncbi:putative reverse transcriptase domain, reverse transcriptase zinc-binding domain protein [Tanacetum coccineum]|uniref:Reverse transcriptase domain, reverse transcriptase zinc-binding domain protein n=1 Tax=Tanacetum coccineum TaxID=301880 RepID=A0ABQ4YYI5_9ASTR